MNVKNGLIIFGFAALALSGAISAKDMSKDMPSKPAKPITEWKCKDYLEIDDMFQPYVVGWATAYSKAGKPEESVIDTEEVETIHPVIYEYCQKNPKASLWNKIKKEAKKSF